jgi:predicted nucleotidyltransferase component of viral defense system
MLRAETVAPATLDLIKRLFQDKTFDEFLLVGGTALSLQIGHRISVDIDLFNDHPFDSEKISNYLASHYKAESIQTLKNGVFCFIEDIKVDLMSHQYPWIKKPILDDGVRMSSLEDISAMKLHAIVQNGSRLKDFVDVYHLLENLTFKSMVDAYERKYPDANRAVAQKAILYHNDIRQSSIEVIGKPLDMETIAKRLKDSVLNPLRIFGQRIGVPDRNNLIRKRKKGRGLR